MCGIGAIINGNKDIKQMMSPVKARGESFNENITGKGFSLACNRLKIVDRENAKQPISNEDNTIFVVFNGEIYNYKELKAELKNHKFKTDSDTEVLVHGYEEWKEKLLDKLDGQFAFVIYNKKTKEFLAARDHYGIKPLFYSKDKDTIYFASEIKQLNKVVKRGIEIKPGFKVTKKGVKRYYKLPKKIIKDDLDAIKKKVKELIYKAVEKRVQTDLPIAVFLSGGIDSTAILDTALRFHNNVTAISIGNEAKELDLHFAKKYCSEKKVKLLYFKLPSEKELFKEIKKIVQITETFEPNVIKQSVFSYFLAKFTRKKGFKIALCGEGADEIFAGYPELTKNTRKNSIRFFNDLYRTQLQRVDRTSMANTLEVRVPFLDKGLVEYCINIPSKYKIRDNTTKWILREAMRGTLPNYIVDRKKIVLSEGMGYKGNNLQKGVFTNLITQEDSEFKKLKTQFKNKKIQTKEEAYYLKICKELNYLNFINKKRVFANRTHTSDNE